ncbi:hypothetical protein BHE74_00051923 [Ensete ventricosum]|nr:hypothetical protein BHE74_00051923 [Ensete ventricosum]
MLAVPDRAAEPEEPSPSSISEADLPIIFAILQDIRQLSHSTPIATRHQFSQRDTRGRTGEEQPSKSTHLCATRLCKRSVRRWWAPDSTRHPCSRRDTRGRTCCTDEGEPSNLPIFVPTRVCKRSGRCRWAPDRWSIPRRRWVSSCWTDGYGKEKCPFVTRLSEWRFRYSDRSRSPFRKRDSKC